jgi:hypothetical protein
VTGADKADFMCGNLLVGSASSTKYFTKEKLITCYHFIYIKFIMLMFNLSLNDFISAEPLIIFYIPLLLSNDASLWYCTKSNARNGKDVVSFISHL